jgi:hypothetical protein
MHAHIAYFCRYEQFIDDILLQFVRLAPFCFGTPYAKLDQNKISKEKNLKAKNIDSLTLIFV